MTLLRPAVATDPMTLDGPAAAALEAGVVADLAAQLGGSAPWRLLGNGAVACAVVALLHERAPWPWLELWLALMLAHLAFSAWGPWGWWPWRPRTGASRGRRVSTTARRLQVVAAAETVTGLLWMGAELLIVPGAEPAQRALLMVLLSGLAVGVLQSLSAHLPALYGFCVPPTLGFFLAGVLGNGPHFGFALALLGVWVIVNISVARTMHRTIVESSRNRHLAAALAADMQLQRDRAVDLGQARSRFLAAASHDLRQPVHALSMLVAALQQDLPAGQARVILRHVDNAVAALGGMFNALLDLSRLDASLVQPQWQVIDLLALLERLAAGHSGAAQAKGLRFQCRLPAAALWVRTDPALLERVLGNLLSNALRYTAQGGVRLQARKRAGRVELVVADTGVGIPREQQAVVFHEFVQLHALPAAADSGLGLGLSIVRRLADLLQLRLILRSRPGRGTLFALHLPLAAPVAPPAVTPAAPAPDRVAGGLRPGDLVLVIDDSAEVRTAMQALLSAWGCEVLAADSAAAVLPQLMHVRRPPRLLLCDYRLGEDGNGMQAIAALRDAFNDDLPAILVTGDTAPERLREASASGLPLLHKPVTLPLLREAIANALDA